jgi:hypothetical protein
MNSLRGKAIRLLLMGMFVVGAPLALETAALADAKPKSRSEKAEKRRRDCLKKCEKRNRNRDCADADGHMMPCPCRCP